MGASADEGTDVSITPRRRVADEVRAALRQLMFSGDLVPGQRLLLSDLEARLGVSPTPIREALTLLEVDGLVAKRPRQGYVVSDMLDREAIEGLYAIRLQLEPWSARLAAERRSAELLKPVLDLVNRKLPVSRPSRNEYRLLSELDIEFHAAVARATGIAALPDVINGLAPKLLHLHAFQQAGAAELAWKEHRVVAEAIADQDPARADQGMHAHLSAALDRMLAASQPDTG